MMDAYDPFCTWVSPETSTPPICPCWIGEDPDGGQCFPFESYHFQRGQSTPQEHASKSVGSVVRLADPYDSVDRMVRETSVALMRAR